MGNAQLRDQLVVVDEELRMGAQVGGDGFGVGWYGERDEPGLFRDVRPAWSDENLKSICAQVRSEGGNCFVRRVAGEAVPMWAKRSPVGKERTQLAQR